MIPQFDLCRCFQGVEATLIQSIESIYEEAYISCFMIIIVKPSCSLQFIDIATF